jgi:hypothetical protein
MVRRKKIGCTAKGWTLCSLAEEETRLAGLVLKDFCLSNTGPSFMRLIVVRL